MTGLFVNHLSEDDFMQSLLSGMSTTTSERVTSAPSTASHPAPVQIARPMRLEDDFMKDLLFEMRRDDSARVTSTSTTQAVLNASPSPSKHAKASTSTSQEIKSLLEGVEEWDWDQDVSMESNVAPVSSSNVAR